MSADEKGPDPRWTDEALDRLLAAVKAEPRAKNTRANPSKEEDGRG